MHIWSAIPAQRWQELVQRSGCKVPPQTSDHCARVRTRVLETTNTMFLLFDAILQQNLDQLGSHPTNSVGSFATPACQASSGRRPGQVTSMHAAEQLSYVSTSAYHSLNHTRTHQRTTGVAPQQLRPGCCFGLRPMAQAAVTFSAALGLSWSTVRRDVSRSHTLHTCGLQFILWAPSHRYRQRHEDSVHTAQLHPQLVHGLPSSSLCPPEQPTTMSTLDVRRECIVGACAMIRCTHAQKSF
jgi:hypothetical protein